MRRTKRKSEIRMKRSEVTNTDKTDNADDAEVTKYFVQQVSDFDWLMTARDSRCAGGFKIWPSPFASNTILGAGSYRMF